jgi:hypothetical protein
MVVMPYYTSQKLYTISQFVILSWRETDFGRWDCDDAMKHDPVRMRSFIVSSYQVA